MSAASYDDLKQHVGHKIAVVDYRGLNAAVECETCHEVLMDFSVTQYGIRLVICMDFDTNDLQEAYRGVQRIMHGAGIGWETSDEWYRGQDDSPRPPEELNKAICKVLEEEEAAATG